MTSFLLPLGLPSGGHKTMRWRSRSLPQLMIRFQLLAVCVLLAMAATVATPPLRVLTTASCDEICADAFTAVGMASGACINIADGAEATEPCRETQELDGVVACSSYASDPKNSALCVTPLADAHAWHFQFTANPELLAVAHARGATSRSEVITLDAANVDSIQGFTIPTSAWMLVLEPADPNEQLRIALDSTAIAKWRTLETL